MIAANKKLLKANLTQGVLGIQTNLINLYTNNLSAVATQAALIAGFAFSAVTSQYVSDPLNISYAEEALSYFYYFFFTVCFVTALFVLSQATVVVTFGPSMALKGNTNDAVKVASFHMHRQQILIYKVASVSITSLFLGACLLCWSFYPIGVSVITTIVYMTTYYILVREALAVYRTFASSENDTFIDSGNTGNIGNSSDGTSDGGYKQLSSGASEAGKSSIKGGESQQASVAHAEALEKIKLKARGILWRRQPMEEGGLFIKCFVVLEKGKLDFYKSSQDFKNDNNPLNKKPLKLWHLDLETDPRKFSKKVTSLRNWVSSQALGNEDFTMSDIMSSEYDLKYASKNFKFALVPKVSSELVAVDISEFIAHDENSYNQWTSAVSTVIEAYNELAASPSLEQTMRIGTADVETVVQAANYA